MIRNFFYNARNFFSFSAILFFVTAVLFAQDNARELIIGSSAAGSLGYGDEIWYSVRSAQNSFLAIETTGDTDTYLEVYDSRNNFIAKDDDGGERNNARVDIYARSGAIFFIKLKGYDAGTAGQYNIKADYMPAPAMTELSIGTPYTGRLSAGDDHWFSVRTNRNGRLVVETSGNTDTYLDVYDNSYAYLSGDDDGGEGKNARVEIIVNANQTHYIKLRAYSRSISGAYRIHANFEEYAGSAKPDYIPPESLPPDTDRNTDRSRAVSAEPEEEKNVIFQGTLNEGRWYTFEITDESNLIITTGGNLNTFLYLYDSRGNLITLDDNSGENYNALISEKLETGIYYIEVMEFFNRAGRCTLRIEIN